MAKNDPQDDTSFTDFARMLATLGGGTVNEKLSERLNEVTRKAREHGKAGEITLKIKVKPAGSIGTMVDLVGKVSAKVPDGELPGSILYAKDDGTLHVEDPRQLKLKTIAPVQRIGPVAKPIPAMPDNATNDDKSED